jgi:hypothetical protein
VKVEYVEENGHEITTLPADLIRKMDKCEDVIEDGEDERYGTIRITELKLPAKDQEDIKRLLKNYRDFLRSENIVEHLLYTLIDKLFVDVEDDVCKPVDVDLVTKYGAKRETAIEESNIKMQVHRTIRHIAFVIEFDLFRMR